MDFALSDSVRTQSTSIVFSSVSSSSSSGRSLAWSRFRAEEAEIRRRYPVGGLLARFVCAVTENFSTDKDAAEVEAFFAERPFAGAERNVRQSLEAIRLRAAWKRREKEALAAFVKAK